MQDKLTLQQAEKALARHPLIRQAVVLVQGDDMAEQVVAYIADDLDDAAEFPDPLCCYLAAESASPAPTVFVRVDGMPQAANGEVDTEELQRAVRSGQDAPGPRVLGGTPAVIADIWRDVLSIDAVMLTDNFFDLGGQSLTITRMTNRIREEIDIDLPLTVFYDSPTVPGIVSAIEESRHSRHGAEQSLSRNITLAASYRRPGWFRYTGRSADPAAAGHGRPLVRRGCPLSPRTAGNGSAWE
jgi:acyl carrier protein